MSKLFTLVFILGVISFGIYAGCRNTIPNIDSQNNVVTLPNEFIAIPCSMVRDLKPGQSGWIAYNYVKVDENGKVWLPDYAKLEKEDHFLEIKYIKVTKNADNKSVTLEVQPGSNYKWEKEELFRNRFLHYYPVTEMIFN